jgi:hypothetical protein
MLSEQTIEGLIVQGWIILDAVDDDAYFKWQTQAVDCLTALLGANHFYCMRLRAFFKETGRKGLLAGTGILAAAREHLAGTELDSCSRMNAADNVDG